MNSHELDDIDLDEHMSYRRGAPDLNASATDALSQLDEKHMRIRELKVDGIDLAALHLVDPDDAADPGPDPFADRDGPEDGWARVDRVASRCPWFAGVQAQDQALALPRELAHRKWAIVNACRFADLRVAADGMPVTCHEVATTLGGASLCASCKYKGKIVGPFQLGREDGEPRADELVAIVHGAGRRLRDDHGAALTQDVLTSLAIMDSEAPAEVARFRQRLKEEKVPLRPFESALKDEKQRCAKRKVFGKGRTVSSILGADCPGAQLLLPDRYVLTPNGIQEVSDGVVRAISKGPILLTGRFIDVRERTEHVRLSWARGSRWDHRAVARAVICDARRLVAVADNGLPVTGTNAARIVDFLHDFEAQNEKLLPTAEITSTLGWQGRDKGFLWGATHICASGTSASVDVQRSDPSTWSKDAIAFHSADPGAGGLVAGYHQRGSWDAWLALVARAVAYPRVMAMIYGALAAALLMLLKIESFIVDLSGRSSTGKTTVMRAAASVCGRPDESAADGVIYSWDSTRVWLERAAATTCDHPLFTDDTKRAKRAEDVTEGIYLIAHGRGRGRAAKAGGFAHATTWRVVMLSTGEAPATSFTQDGGSRTRVIALTGLPFDGDDDVTRKIVEDLNHGFKTHYGHAFPRFVAWLLRNMANVGQWQARHRSLAADYVASATASGPAARMADHAAAVTLAGELFHEAFAPPWMFVDPIKPMWSDIVARAADADMAARALDAVRSWAFSNRASFWSTPEAIEPETSRQPRAPIGGWAGRWEASNQFGYVGFYPHVLRRVLSEAGFRTEEVLSSWMERGHLETDKEEQRRTKKVTIDGDEVRLHCIRRAAIDDADDAGFGS